MFTSNVTVDMDTDIFVDNKTSEAIFHMLTTILDHSHIQNNSEGSNMVIVIIDSCLALVFGARVL